LDVILFHFPNIEVHTSAQLTANPSFGEERYYIWFGRGTNSFRMWWLKKSF